MDIEEFAEQIQSKEDFEKFLRHLLQNLATSREQWSNVTLEQFLGGLCGFAHDMQGYYRNRGETVDLDQPTWKILADLLLAARVYE